MVNVAGVAIQLRFTVKPDWRQNFEGFFSCHAAVTLMVSFVAIALGNLGFKDFLQIRFKATP
ncbi:MAG: hypothetical protein EA343_08175 [Nodularia sp. (in: Bacteria)]|nr:MAG: hypothetical protein EA343_08175 [Nodularia sp. (in: cyanobacteria)]